MSSQRTWANVLGFILVIVGLWGFFGDGTVLMFTVNSTHSWIHLISGVLALLAGYTAGGGYAKSYNTVFGLVYLLVALLGLFNVQAIVELLALNAADNWLHLLIGLVTVFIGFRA